MVLGVLGAEAGQDLRMQASWRPCLFPPFVLCTVAAVLPPLRCKTKALVSVQKRDPMAVFLKSPVTANTERREKKGFVR